MSNSSAPFLSLQMCMTPGMIFRRIHKFFTIFNFEVFNVNYEMNVELGMNIFL